MKFTLNPCVALGNYTFGMLDPSLDAALVISHLQINIKPFPICEAERHLRYCTDSLCVCLVALVTTRSGGADGTVFLYSKQ